MNAGIPILIPSTGLNIPSICAGLTATLSATHDGYGPILYAVPRDRRKDLCENYTFRHLCALAKLRSINVQVLGRSWSTSGLSCVSAQCNTLIDECVTSEVVIIQGDDVLPDSKAYFNLILARIRLEQQTANWGFICGAKLDIENDRNYPDFSTAEVKIGSLEDYCSTHTRIFVSEHGIRHMFACRALDSGFCMLNAARLRSLPEPVRFSLHTEIAEYGGEDTLFGMESIAAGLRGFFCPAAVAWHLNNPGSQFHGKEAKRLELLRIIAQEQDLPMACIDDAFRGR